MRLARSGHLGKGIDDCLSEMRLWRSRRGILDLLHVVLGAQAIDVKEMRTGCFEEEKTGGNDSAAAAVAVVAAAAAAAETPRGVDPAAAADLPAAGTAGDTPQSARCAAFERPLQAPPARWGSVTQPG